MNKKVFVSMLVLTMVFLAAMYVLKIFFPQEFILIVDNSQLIKIGDYIDNHLWAYYVYTSITAFITYFFYLCAVCRKKYLNIKEFGIVVLTIIITFIVDKFDLTLAMHLNISSMLILPLIFKARLKEVAIVYSIHGLAQCLSLNIRQLPLYLIANSVTSTLLIIECYFWLLLFYIIYNYKKEE